MDEVQGRKGGCHRCRHSYAVKSLLLVLICRSFRICKLPCVDRLRRLASRKSPLEHMTAYDNDIPESKRPELLHTRSLSPNKHFSVSGRQDPTGRDHVIAGIGRRLVASRLGLYRLIAKGGRGLRREKGIEGEEEDEDKALVSGKTIRRSLS